MNPNCFGKGANNVPHCTCKKVFMWYHDSAGKADIGCSSEEWAYTNYFADKVLPEGTEITITL
jgi:hypothetical protein